MNATGYPATSKHPPPPPVCQQPPRRFHSIIALLSHGPFKSALR